MIERDRSGMQLVCDATGVRFPKTFDADDFDDMIAEAKEAGWLVKLERGEWRHYSPDARSAATEFGAVEGIE